MLGRKAPCFASVLDERGFQNLHRRFKSLLAEQTGCEEIVPMDGLPLASEGILLERDDDEALGGSSSSGFQICHVKQNCEGHAATAD
jgi:hypothetical protein